MGGPGGGLRHVSDSARESAARALVLRRRLEHHLRRRSVPWLPGGGRFERAVRHSHHLGSDDTLRDDAVPQPGWRTIARPCSAAGAWTQHHHAAAAILRDQRTDATRYTDPP